jgi:uncharacterized membrane protein
MSFVRRYSRFVLFFVLLVVAAPVLMLWFKPVPSVLGGFDIAALVFIVALIRTLGDDRADEMRQRASDNEPDQYILSLVGGVVFAVVVVAVGLELSDSHARDVALSGGTLILAWAFGNILFALHYAHAFYSSGNDGKDRGGLDFPGDAPPGYWDFAYFAFVLGMTFQVSDVEITGSGLRRVALVHSMIAFLFNIGVIALTVSLIGNLLK